MASVETTSSSECVSCSDLLAKVEELLSTELNDLLFMKDDLEPMEFSIAFTSVKEEEGLLKKFKTLIQMCGGFLKFNMQSPGPHSTRLSLKKTFSSQSEDVFLATYVIDCVKANMKLDLNSYRAGKSKSKSKGGQTPGSHPSKNIEEKTKSSGQIVSDFSDDDDGGFCVPKTVKNPRRWAKVYSFDEDKAILSYIINNYYWNKVKGNTIWKRMENDEVCKSDVGSRTWQSMKERYLKHIIPRIDQYHLGSSAKSRLMMRFTNGDDEDFEVFEADHNSRFRKGASSNSGLNNHSPNKKRFKLNNSENNDRNTRKMESGNGCHYSSDTDSDADVNGKRNHSNIFSTPQKSNVSPVRTSPRLSKLNGISPSIRNANNMGESVGPEGTQLDLESENKLPSSPASRNIEKTDLGVGGSSSKHADSEAADEDGIDSSSKSSGMEISNEVKIGLPRIKRKQDYHLRENSIKNSDASSKESNGIKDMDNASSSVNALTNDEQQSDISSNSGDLIMKKDSIRRSLSSDNSNDERNDILIPSSDLSNTRRISPRKRDQRMNTDSRISPRRISPSKRVQPMNTDTSNTPRKISPRKKTVVLKPDSASESEDSGDNDRTTNGSSSVERRKTKSASRSSSANSTPNRVNKTLSFSDSDSREDISRQQYLGYKKDDDLAILEYICRKNLYVGVRGRAIWEEMEKREIVRERTWQSLKERFLKRILPRIESYKSINQVIIQKFIRVCRLRGVDGAVQSKRIFKPSSYTLFEDDNIINFIKENRRYDEVKGKAMWVGMSKTKGLKQRSWESLKNRFLRNIMPHIDMFGLTKEEVLLFKRGLKGKGKWTKRTIVPGKYLRKGRTSEKEVESRTARDGSPSSSDIDGETSAEESDSLSSKEEKEDSSTDDEMTSNSNGNKAEPNNRKTRFLKRNIATNKEVDQNIRKTRSMRDKKHNNDNVDGSPSDEADTSCEKLPQPKRKKLFNALETTGELFEKTPFENREILPWRVRSKFDQKSRPGKGTTTEILPGPSSDKNDHDMHKNTSQNEISVSPNSLETSNNNSTSSTSSFKTLDPDTVQSVETIRKNVNSPYGNISPGKLKESKERSNTPTTPKRVSLRSDESVLQSNKGESNTPKKTPVKGATPKRSPSTPKRSPSTPKSSQKNESEKQELNTEESPSKASRKSPRRNLNEELNAISSPSREDVKILHSPQHSEFKLPQLLSSDRNSPNKPLTRLSFNLDGNIKRKLITRKYKAIFK